MPHSAKSESADVRSIERQATEASARRLRAELERERDHVLRFAKSNHIVLTLLVLVTIGSSALAGVLGLGFGVNTRIVAAIALIPGIAAATNNQLRLQNRCNWHYRKYDALKALLRKLDYGLPNNATVADVAKISDQLSELETQMTREWENSFRVMPEDLRGHPSSSGTFPERGGAREDK